MKKELPYFQIGTSYGGNQDWFSDYWMREGGCGAETACDVSVYLAVYRGIPRAYPFRIPAVREDYVEFSEIMRPYLSPRWTGIDRLDIYIDGFGSYLRDRGVDAIVLAPWEGTHSYEETRGIVHRQIDAEMPIPCLTLKHRAPSMDFYVWHWYLLPGYEDFDGECAVKAVTYGHWRWLDLRTLWESGYERRGGLWCSSRSRRNVKQLHKNTTRAQSHMRLRPCCILVQNRHPRENPPVTSAVWNPSGFRIGIAAKTS